MRCISLLLLTTLAVVAEPRASFTIHEHFGVAHPEQIIDFDLPTGMPTAGAQVVDGEGTPVPFQFIDEGRKVAVRSALEAHASRTWSVIDGDAALPADGVTVTEHEAYWEVTNGLTGVRVPKAVAIAADQQELPAPLQAVRMRDGSWAGSGGVNPLRFQSSGDWEKQTVATAMTVRFLERGPLLVRLEVDYRFETPAYRYGQQQTREAGPGVYRCTIELQAGQPSILFEEETDIEPSWRLDLYEAVQPTHARYRGHHSRSPEAGYEPGGGVYRASHMRRGLDAQVDFTYEQPRGSGYTTTDTMWRWMAVWDPWVFNSGWYWQAFNNEAAPDANLIGIFAGPASRAIGAGASGVGFWTEPADADGQRAFGIAMQSYRRGPDARLYPRSRFAWGLFVGTRAELLAPEEVQPINRQMNIHGGINLNKVHRWTLEFADPPNGYGGAFMPVEAVQAVKARAAADNEYFRWLYNADPYSRPLFDAWRDESGAKRTAAVEQVIASARDMLERLVNSGGIYEVGVHYWHGGLMAMRYGVWIDQLLADPELPAEQRQQLKAAAVMFANIVWDDDHAPISSTVHGLNLGTENMPLQQWGYRRFYALFMARHPTMVERTTQVIAGLRASVEQQINEAGAHIGCTHYIGASFAPTLNNLLQVKQLGVVDPFADWPKLAAFARFYLNLLTPPEPRVGDKRCFIALGDSGTEPSEIYGVLGTGFRDADPALSAHLMHAWEAGGKPHSFFFGSTVLMIDDRLPTADPGLGDASFPGYYTVLRHGWGTPDESAMWIVNGDHYRDHRHHDQGALVLYALGQPLMLDWSAIYTPHTPGAYLHNNIVPERAIGHAWDRNGVNLGAGSRTWHTSRQEAFNSTAGQATCDSVFDGNDITWTRRVAADRSDAARPLYLVRDTFAGELAMEPKVASFHLLATGPVQTPAGEVEPPLHAHPNANNRADAPVTELPSATKPIALAAGLHRFGFTGRHGVEVDLYVVATQPIEALVGSWAVTAWGSHVTDRDERQHILRIRGEAGFTTLFVPRRQGDTVAAEVTLDGETLVITRGGTAVRLSLN